MIFVILVLLLVMSSVNQTTLPQSASFREFFPNEIFYDDKIGKMKRFMSSSSKREVVNATDECLYNKREDICGDKCMYYYGSSCKCGNEAFNIRENRKFCCVSPSNTCTGGVKRSYKHTDYTQS